MRKADQHQNKALWGEESRSKQHRIDDEWWVRLETGPQVTHKQMQMQSVSERVGETGGRRCCTLRPTDWDRIGIFPREATYIRGAYFLSLFLFFSHFIGVKATGPAATRVC